MIGNAVFRRKANRIQIDYWTSGESNGWIECLAQGSSGVGRMSRPECINRQENTSTAIPPKQRKIQSRGALLPESIGQLFTGADIEMKERKEDAEEQ